MLRGVVSGFDAAGALLRGVVSGLDAAGAMLRGVVSGLEQCLEELICENSP